MNDTIDKNAQKITVMNWTKVAIANNKLKIVVTIELANNAMSIFALPVLLLTI